MNNSKSIIYMERLNPMKPGMPILTAKDLKALLKYVENEARKKRRKNRSSRRAMTDELMVFILARGLNAGELLNLNIEDLPCYHGESHIIVHNRGDSKTREVYLLYDILESKINEYVQNFRQRAKPSEPLFISRHGNRTAYRTLANKFCGQKGKPGGRPSIGFAQKLGINHLTPGIFKRTTQYQVAGERNPDKNAERERLKSKVVATTLKEFIERYCKGNYSGTRLDDLVKRFYNANTRMVIELPKHIEPYRKGQSKRYYVSSLARSWLKHKNGVTNLPLLDYCRLSIVFRNSQELQEF